MLHLTFIASLLALLVANAQASKFQLKEVLCADKKSYCPDGSTCCQMLDGSYGCCPLLHAVCCPDHVHCCPEGTQCDPEEGMCVSAIRRYPMYRKLPASSRQPHVHGEGADFDEVTFPSGNDENETEDVGREVECPDHKSKCPPHTTCCPLDDSTTSDTSYGCCASEDAVCCEDKIHCCPHGMICDLEAMRCTPAGSGISRPWYKKFVATSTSRKPSVKATTAALNQCSASKDGGDEETEVTSACESGTKCCSVSVGSAHPAYCCPLADGECCAEVGYCCPKGFRCSEYLQCTMVEPSGARFSMNAFKSQLAPLEKALSSDEKTTCGDGSQCDSLHTCCAIRNPINWHKIDSYRCCPLSGQASVLPPLIVSMIAADLKATCCASGESCCPRGYRCVLNGRGCEKIASYGVRLFLD